MRALLMLSIVVVFVPVFLTAIQQKPDSAKWLQVNWEREKFEQKIPTDTIYIHHTALPSGITLQEMSDLQRKRLYVPVYETLAADPPVKGQEPYSGHFQLREGALVEVFYGYHWLIRTDGTAVRLLQDTEVGWHAGNWQENMRSIAICMDGDYSKTNPPQQMLAAVAQLISRYCKTFSLKRLKAHYDINPRRKEQTECPGSWFDSKDHQGLTGRDRLMGMANVQLARD